MLLSKMLCPLLSTIHAGPGAFVLDTKYKGMFALCFPTNVGRVAGSTTAATRNNQKEKMSITTLSAGQLREAARIKDKIEELQNELTKIFGHAVGNGSPAVKAPKKGRRKMSAAAKAKIAAAQKARWAKWKAAKK